MYRSGTVVSTAFLTVGLALAAFAAPAAAGEQLTKKELQRATNTICEGVNEAIDTTFEQLFEGITEGIEPSDEAAAAVVATAVATFRAALDQIEALDGPSAYEKKVDKMLDQYQAAADDVEADPELALDEEGPVVFTTPDKQAKRLGLDECVQND